MRVLVCPDSFTGTLSASEAAAAIAEGWQHTAATDEITLMPLSDGGPGFADAMATALSGAVYALEAKNLEGMPAVSHWVRVGDTAYIESASVIGMHLVTTSTIWQRTSFGVGELICAAIDSGCKKIVVGLGGTGTNDAGLGALIALGAQVFDDADDDISLKVKAGPEYFSEIARVNLAPALVKVSTVEIEVATDVDNPLLGLRGASHEYAPQKGAHQSDVIQLEALLHKVSSAIGRRADGKDPAVALGAGAAGGLGFGLLALGATRTSGIDRILDALELDDVLRNVDLVVTGEGHFDWQSLRGKVIAGVSRRAMQVGRPVIVVAGQLSLTRRDWGDIGVSAAYSVVEFAGFDASMNEPYAALRDTAARLARTWSR